MAYFSLGTFLRNNQSFLSIITGFENRGSTVGLLLLLRFRVGLLLSTRLVSSR